MLIVSSHQFVNAHTYILESVCIDVAEKKKKKKKKKKVNSACLIHITKE